jgi:hypothetical protein
VTTINLICSGLVLLKKPTLAVFNPAFNGLNPKPDTQT